MAKKKRSTWSVPRITDPRFPGLVLRVTELKKGGSLYVVRMVDGQQRMASLRVKRADLGTTPAEQERQARVLALGVMEELAEGGPLPSAKPAAGPQPGEILTLGGLADLYERHALHGRSEKYQKEQPVKVRRIVAFLGPDRDARGLSKSDVERFAASRQAAGVRQGTIWADVTAMKIALNWATEHKRDDGSPLLEANPLARLRVTREKAPRRPVAMEDRYQALKGIAGGLPHGFELALDLAFATGHRIGAILSLKWQDVSFETSEEAPNGTIRWYAGRKADTKKAEHVVPMNALARAALEREREERPGIGAGWIFPAAEDPTRHTRYYVARRWMGRAEKLAKLPPLKGGKWHPFRRGWATARKHYPLNDVAAAGGWRDTATLQRSYIHTDAQTVLSVVNG